MPSDIMRKCCSVLPMLFHAVWNHDRMLYHASHAFWSHENEELPCFPCCLKSWENALPCSPCFSMLSDIMRKCCTMLPMLFHAVLNHKKVLSHEFHANPCSTGVTWKIFPCFPCFWIAWKSKGSMGSMGKPWSPHEFLAFPHASYTRVGEDLYCEKALEKARQ